MSDEEEHERADEHSLSDAPEEPPPLGTWPRMYALVLGSLALWIALFILFTRAFS